MSKEEEGQKDEPRTGLRQPRKGERRYIPKRKAKKDVPGKHAPPAETSNLRNKSAGP